MNKKIEFTYEGQKYVLEYNRRSIQIIEAQGFSINELSAKPMTMIPLAFEGLFIKNHKNITRKKVEEIFDSFKNKDKLMEAITTMLTETYSSLQSNLEDGSDEEQGNIEWEIL